ncbi:MAG: multidrug effflux MFS transporter [Sphingobacteriales bacterium]|nr:multidrug effflux MFS transporter [Sphingobacteriales bacterium]MBI3718381.1 multidrug effflux MFS transporter [Sphingobacteriales bacterium]
MALAERSKQQTFFLILILGALNAITPFSIDMYLPAFPRIAADFNSTVEKVALSVSTYFLGFALGQIIYGPLLDRFGRKPPLYAGLLLYIVATVGCFTSGGIEALWLMRFTQALGGCVASVAAMAMVRDFFPVEKSAGVISLLVLILGASPLLAPTLGSFIVVWWGWRFVFIMLSVITFIILVVVFFFLPEGHLPDKTISLKPSPIIKGFKEVLTNPKFYVFALAGSFSFSGLFVYVAHSPAIFMNHFHLSEKLYGGVFALLSVGFIGGSQLNHILTKEFSNRQILKTALLVQAVIAVLFLIGAYNNWYGISSVIILLFALLSCCGITYPNAAALCMAPFSKNAGTASSLLGFTQIGLGGLISGSVSMLPFNAVTAMALIMAVTVVIALLILRMGGK